MTRSAEDYLKQGNEFFKKGDFDKAIVHYTEAIRFNRDYASAYFNRSKAYEKKGDYEKAKEDYDQAIYLNPEFGREDSNNRGKKEHESELQRGKGRDPLTSEHFMRGNNYLEEDNYEQAIEEFSKVIDMYPDFDLAYSARGDAYHMKGEYDKAIADHNKVIDLNPNSASGYMGRGGAYLGKKDFDKALKELNKALQVEPDNTPAKITRAHVYIDIGDNKRAIAEFEAIIQENPNDQFAAIARQQLEKIGKVNMHKVQKYELCSSCLNVRPVLSNGSLGITIAEVLDSKAFNAGNPLSLQMMNITAFTYLTANGGCANCINLFRQLLLESGLSQEYLNELGTS